MQCMINAKVAESKDETKDLGNELAHCGMQFNMVVYRPPSALKHYTLTVVLESVKK